MTMIRDYLIPALKEEFSGWEISYDSPPNPVATFPAAQEQVGKVFICDDGDEATVCIEKITHGHFNDYDAVSGSVEKEKAIVQSVIDFLKALFSDRVLLFTNPDNSAGGWIMVDGNDGPVELSRSHRYFLWSKPFTS
jgi:hypothetical protein